MALGSQARAVAIVAALALGAASGCVRMTHQLEQSKPLEINVNVRLIDDRLDEFYEFERKFQNGAAPGAATQPAS